MAEDSGGSSGMHLNSQAPIWQPSVPQQQIPRHDAPTWQQQEHQQVGRQQGGASTPSEAPPARSSPLAAANGRPDMSPGAQAGNSGRSGTQLTWQQQEQQHEQQERQPQVQERQPQQQERQPQQQQRQPQQQRQTQQQRQQQQQQQGPPQQQQQQRRQQPAYVQVPADPPAPSPQRSSAPLHAADAEVSLRPARGNPGPQQRRGAPPPGINQPPGTDDPRDTASAAAAARRAAPPVPREPRAPRGSLFQQAQNQARQQDRVPAPRPSPSAASQDAAPVGSQHQQHQRAPPPQQQQQRNQPPLQPEPDAPSTAAQHGNSRAPGGGGGGQHSSHQDPSTSSGRPVPRGQGKWQQLDGNDVWRPDVPPTTPPPHASYPDLSAAADAAAAAVARAVGGQDGLRGAHLGLNSGRGGRAAEFAAASDDGEALPAGRGRGGAANGGGGGGAAGASGSRQPAAAGRQPAAGRQQGAAAPGAAGGGGGSSGSQRLTTADLASMYGAAAEGVVGGSEEEEEDECTFTCIVCCEPTYAMAIGKCDHHQVCAKCCLRLRLCYNDRKCPLCKSENDDVVVVRPPADAGAIPSYQSLLSSGDQLWAKPKWARGVMVFDPPPTAAVGGGGGAAPHVPLHIQMMRLTAAACGVCDRVGRHPFASEKAMKEHLRERHSRQLCPICFEARHKFPLEYEVFTDAQLAPHIATVHQHCQFCAERFYGLDELYAHMTQKHYTCHVCQRAGIAHFYLRNAQDLTNHFHHVHYACTEPDCVDSFIAFATEEELKQHSMQRHSSYMPRWDSSRSRPMVLDLSPASHPRHSAARGGGRGGRRAANVAEPSYVPPGGDGSSSRPAIARLDAQRDTEGGQMIIDDSVAYDDIGPSSQQSGGGRAGQQGGGGGSGAGQSGRLLSGAWARRAGDPAPTDEYPSLAVSAALVPAAVAAAAGGWAQRPALPTLRKVTVKCPCGRRTSQLAVLEDEKPRPLVCDKECTLAVRRSLLASAFGVDDPETHVSTFERSRAANYAPSLIQSAQSHLEWLRLTEAELSEFMSNKALKRVTLPPASAERRQLTHELAAHYGLATHSLGQEPSRAVQLFKTETSGVPQRSLAAVASTTTRAQLAELLASVPNWSLHVFDVAANVNLGYHLREWKEEFSIAWEGGERDRGASAAAGRGATATVTFTSERAFRGASDALAGGVRGEFRIQQAGGGAAAAAAAPRAGPSMALAGPGGTAAAPTGWQVVTKGKSTKRGPEAGGTPAAAGSSSSSAPGGSSANGSSSAAGAGAGGGVALGAIARARGAGAAGGKDPWEDDEGGGAKAGGARVKPVAEDWEEEVGGAEVPLRAPMDLGDSNAWDALLEQGDDEEEQEDAAAAGEDDAPPAWGADEEGDGGVAVGGEGLEGLAL